MTPERRRRGLLVGAFLLFLGLLVAGPGQWLLRWWELPLWPAALAGFVLRFGGASIVYLAARAR